MTVTVEGQIYEGMGNNKKSAKVAAATAALDSLALTGVLATRQQEIEGASALYSDVTMLASFLCYRLSRPLSFGLIVDSHHVAPVAANRELRRQKNREFMQSRNEMGFGPPGAGLGFQGRGGPGAGRGGFGRGGFVPRGGGAGFPRGGGAGGFNRGGGGGGFNRGGGGGSFNRGGGGGTFFNRGGGRGSGGFDRGGGRGGGRGRDAAGGGAPFSSGGGGNNTPTTNASSTPAAKPVNPNALPKTPCQKLNEMFKGVPYKVRHICRCNQQTYNYSFLFCGSY